MTRLNPLRYDCARWAPSLTNAASDNTLDTLSIVTFNVLFDRAVRSGWQDATFHADERFAHALAELDTLRADIIALQEMTPTLMQRLLAEPWVQRAYSVTHGADDPALRPYGQVVLSKLPIRSASTYQFGATSIKRVLLVDWIINGRVLSLANVHLPAGHDGHDTENDLQQRRGQLKRVFSLLDNAPESTDRVICGDFNFGDNHAQNEMLHADAYVDCWRAVRPLNPGYTCDTRHNSLTSILCPGEPPVRLDRILLHSERWRPTSASIVMQRPFPSNANNSFFMSDHFGVFVQLNFLKQ